MIGQILKTFLVLALVTQSFTGKAQNLYNLVSANTVSTITYWEVGDQEKYRMTASSENTVNNKTKTNDEVSYDILVKVVSKTDSFYVVEMMYMNYVIPTDLKIEPLMKRLIKVCEGLKVRYKITDVGQFVEILNTDELAKGIAEQIDLIIKELSENTKDDKELQQVLATTLETMKKSFTSKENIEAMYGQDLLMLHGMYGFEFKLNESLEFDIEYLVMNNLEVNGVANVKLNSINKSGKTFSMNVVEYPNKEEMKAYIKNILTSLSPSTTDETEIAKSKFDIRTTSKYVYDLENGWIISVNQTQNIDLSTEDDQVKVVKKKTLTAL